MTANDWYEFEIDSLERRIEYLQNTVDRLNRIRREISSYLIRERDHVNVLTALDIIYPGTKNITPAEPGKGTK